MLNRFVRTGFLALLVDLRGHGDTSLPMLSNRNTYTEDIRKVIDYLSTLKYVDSKSFSVIGHSMGGGIAISVGYVENRIKATVGIAPATSPQFVNLTHPKNLLIVLGAKDQLLSLEYEEKLLEEG